MMLEREHLRLSRPVLDLVQRGGIVAEIVALFHAITHHDPKLEADTSIAWEDGESEAADARPADGP